MGGSTKLLTLLSTQTPFFYSRSIALNFSRYTQLALTSFYCHHHHHSLFSLPLRVGIFRIRIHTGAATLFRGEGPGFPSFEDSASTAASGNEMVWISIAEWWRFVDYLRKGLRNGSERGGVDAGDDSFSGFEKLPAEFVAAAQICLRFARQRPEVLRLLSKRDVDLIVTNGSPFLFKHASNSSRRMHAFINDANGGVSENGTETAETVDLMRYLLGHIYNNLFSPKAVEESVRNIFNQLVNPTETKQLPNFTEMCNQSSNSFEQSSLHFKRGLICSKRVPLERLSDCQYMRNNGGRIAGTDKIIDQQSTPADAFRMSQIDDRQQHQPTGIPSVICEIGKSIDNQTGVIQEGENRFIVSKKKNTTNMSNSNNVINGEDFLKIMPSVEDSSRHASNRRMVQEGLIHNQYKRNIRDPDGSRIAGTKYAISETLERLDKIIAEKQTSYTEGKVSGHTGRSNRSLPFVSLRADMFRKSQTDGRQQKQTSGNSNSSLKSDKWVNASSSEISETGKSVDNQTRAVQEEECRDVITMPNGENRSVVSKKKNINMSNLNNVTNDKDLPALKPLKEDVFSHVDSNSRMPLEGLTGDINSGRIVGTKPQFSKFLERLDRIINQQKTPTDMFSKSQTDDCQHQPSGISDSSLKSDMWVTEISATEKYINNQTGVFQEQEFPDTISMRTRKDQHEVNKKKDTDVSDLYNVINDENFLPEIMSSKEDASTSSKHADSDSRVPLETRNTGSNDSVRITGTKSQISKFLERLDSIIEQQTTQAAMCKKETS